MTPRTRLIHSVVKIIFFPHNEPEQLLERPISVLYSPALEALYSYVSGDPRRPGRGEARRGEVRRCDPSRRAERRALLSRRQVPPLLTVETRVECLLQMLPVIKFSLPVPHLARRVSAACVGNLLRHVIAAQRHCEPNRQPMSIHPHLHTPVTAPHSAQIQPTWASTRNVWLEFHNQNKPLPHYRCLSLPALPSHLSSVREPPRIHNPCETHHASVLLDLWVLHLIHRYRFSIFDPNLDGFLVTLFRVKMSMNDAHYLTRATVNN
ncbi:hypothetical protein E2C01_012556 [Portunus trituberculatus]|uniref:Uncharacterized protein n=1 Tax=Portunus trituberculatus TaxID=210409 RepID=A0A5B7DEF9_PORTR|nr:hypothetical protein [Portunus trituberculatus]